MKYLLAGFFLCASLCLSAQQNHFIYLQTDNRQPFYVKLDKKILSSSISGYLIIPKLTDTTCSLVIGFPRNEWPEQKVTCNTGQSDIGFLLKNFGEKGWGLFNFQSMNLTMAQTINITDSSGIAVQKEDPFAASLSEVVNDPSLRKTETAAQMAENKALPQKNGPDKKKMEGKPPKPLIQPAKKIDAPDSRNRIRKIAWKMHSDPVKMVYLDIVKGKADTVVVELPVAKAIMDEKKQNRVFALKEDRIKNAGQKTTERKPAADMAKSGKKPESGIEKINKKVGDSLSISQAEKNIETANADPVKKDYYKLEPLKDTEVPGDKGSEKEEIKQVAATTELGFVGPLGDPDFVKQFYVKKEEKRPGWAITKTDFVGPMMETLMIVQPAVKKQETLQDMVKIREAYLGPLQDTVSLTETVVKKEEIKPGPAKTENNHLEPLKDAVLNAPPEEKKEEGKTDLVKTKSNKQELLKDTVLNIQPDEKKEAVRPDLVKTDKRKPEPPGDSHKDTQPVVKKEEQISGVTKTENTRQEPLRDVAVITKPAEKKEEVKAGIVKETMVDNGKTNVNTPFVRVPCKNFAEADDFLNLKKKWLKVTDEEEILRLAHKEFLKKCFSAKHLERLGLLLITEDARYRFFEEGYQHVSDVENFPSLEAQLKDGAYIKKFRALLQR